MQFMMGEGERSRAQSIHPLLGNLDRLRYTMNKSQTTPKKKNPSSALLNMGKWEDDIGLKFIQSTNVARESEGAIIFQFPHMADIAKENDLYAFQTDSLEGWVQDEEYQAMTVTITAAYSKVLERHAPVLLSVTYRRTAEHYKAHFDVFLKKLGYSIFDEFKNTFPGMICDFSQAEKKGFKLSILSLFGNEISDINEIDIERYYKFCIMHFKEQHKELCYQQVVG